MGVAWRGYPELAGWAGTRATRVGVTRPWAALGVPEVHAWLVTSLGLPENVALVPLTNEGPRRPDLWAIDQDDRRLAVIEVELARDVGQIEDYTSAFPGFPVYTIWDRHSDGGTTSLEDLCDALGQMRPTVHQQRRQVQFLKTLIEEALQGYRRGSKRDHVSEEVRGSPFVVALLARIGDRVDFAAGNRVQPGRIGATTNGPRGLSLRGASTKANGGSVALLSIPRGREVATVRSRDHLLRYLPSHRAAVEAWLDFLAPLCREARAQDTTMPVAALIQHIDEVVSHLLALTELRGATPR
jgi:hypothetical protein